MRARTGALDMRNDTTLAQLGRYLIGVLNTGLAENINEVLWVDGTNGSDANDGKAPDRAKKTISAAAALAAAYDTIAVFPATYDEHVALATDNVTLIGLGDTPRQTIIRDDADSAVEQVAVTGSNVTISNVMIQNGHANNVEAVTIGACDYCTLDNCIFEKYASIDLDEAVRIMGPNTNIGHIIRDCFFNGHILGIVFEDSTTNAADVHIIRCLFDNGTTADITDSADVSVTGVLIQDCIFKHAAVTDFIVLDNASTEGLMVGCRFNEATFATGTITIDAGLECVDCHTLAGENIAVPA